MEIHDTIAIPPRPPSNLPPLPPEDLRSGYAEKKNQKVPVWAQVVGIIGELFITAGILIGAYIAWQLWISGWETDSINNNAVASASQEWQQSPQKIGTPRYDDPPEFEHITQLGATLGIIHIPAFGSEWEYAIWQGANKEAILDKGAFGHYKDTAYPGEIGNFAMAAHRNTYGAPMHYVENLKVGDDIIIETKDAYLVYKIEPQPYVVKPTQGEVIWPVPGNQNAEPTERLLTITTCHPYIGIQIERMITHAKLDHWVDRNDGIPEEMFNKNQ